MSFFLKFFKSFLNVLCFLLFCLQSFSQYTIHLRVKPAFTHINDTIYVAGNFNEWNPGNSQYRLNKSGEILTIDIPGLSKDIYQYKFTRGSWQTPEVSPDGNDIENRLITLTSDTIIECSIGAWKDDFPKIPKQHTASPNVRIVDTAFYMPELDRKRRIWIYLPPGYSSAKHKRRYPVLYMHDGQNIFDHYTSGYGEWGVDECLDSLIRQGIPASIVVGIDCGPKRMNEYNPYYFEKFGAGEGDEYVEFLVNTLKPFIDKRYRTKSSKENTFIAGSSMGGLISYYAMLTYPNVFANAGIFSPAFWTAPLIKPLTDSLAYKITGKIFFYMGELEGGTYVADMKEVADKVGGNSSAVIYTVIDPVSRHNEQAWGKWFPEFYCWITGDGLNNTIKAHH